MLEFEQLKWYLDYFGAFFLHGWQPCDVKVTTLLFCPLCLALALGGSGDCGFYAHRTGSGPCSHWDEKAPPCSPHVRWAAFSWADEGVWEGFSQCQEGKAVAFVSLSTTLKGVGTTQIVCIRFAPWDYCRHFPREAFCISLPCWAVFRLNQNHRHVGSNSSVYLINFLKVKSLCTALYLSTCCRSSLHSEVLYFYLGLFLFVV